MTAKQGCCRFFSFALVIDARGIPLDVHAPPDATYVVTALFDAADSVTALFGAVQ